MPHELRICKLIERLEKQKAIHLANMNEHKRLVEFSKQNAEACLVTIASLDIAIEDIKALLEDEETK
tara:strand:+ start:874 stop:1074 length:201 start_codon:yes stop_codon:yes gene_type:complete